MLERANLLALEDEGSTLGLLVTTKLKVLAALEGHVRPVLACCALETQDDLFRRLCLFVKDWLCLTTVTLLLGIVTALTLSVEGGLASFVLSDLVGPAETNQEQHASACYFSSRNKD